MTTGSTGTKRRTFFQRGLALLAGGTALAGTSRWAAAASPPAPPGKTLTLYARARPAAGHDHGAGRIIAMGDLLDGPAGARIGAFFTNCFCVPTPFGGVQRSAESTLEFHVLQLEDGTLFSMGAGGTAADQGFAIIGGTDRFAGRSGACVLRVVEARADVRQLTITFAA